MEPNSLDPRELSEAELHQLRRAFELQYPLAKEVLGSQLGAFINTHLTNANLKSRFGGLKKFVGRYFPAEIRWRDRDGLDDIYDVAFGDEKPDHRPSAWRRVEPNPSAALWTSVTNPSIDLQFAWLNETQSLMRAPGGVSLQDGLVAVEKLTKGDYQTIARAFLQSIENVNVDQYLDLLAKSIGAFTNQLRENNLLPKWEVFRVDHVLRLFSDRLQTAGAESRIALQWSDLLRSSQQEARSERVRKSTALSALKRPIGSNTASYNSQQYETRAVAVKALEFLTEDELRNLKLPLGYVLDALASLLRS